MSSKSTTSASSNPEEILISDSGSSEDPCLVSPHCSSPRSHRNSDSEDSIQSTSTEEEYDWFADAAATYYTICEVADMFNEWKMGLPKQIREYRWRTRGFYPREIGDEIELVNEDAYGYFNHKTESEPGKREIKDLNVNRDLSSDDPEENDTASVDFIDEFVFEDKKNQTI